MLPSEAAAGLRRRRRRGFGFAAAPSAGAPPLLATATSAPGCCCAAAAAAGHRPSSCACACATCATVPSARAGCRRARSRSPGSRQSPRAPGRAHCSPAACTPRRRRGARSRPRAAAPSRPGSASRRSPRAGGPASLRPHRAGAWPPETRCWRGGPEPSASPWRASTSSAGESDRERSPCLPRSRGAGSSPRPPVLVPRRRLADERDQIVEVGALDGHRDAVLERGHPQPAVRISAEQTERKVSSAALDARPRRTSSQTRRADRSATAGRRWSPSSAARPRPCTSGRSAATRAGSPRAGARRRASLGRATSPARACDGRGAGRGGAAPA